MSAEEHVARPTQDRFQPAGDKAEQQMAIHLQHAFGNKPAVQNFPHRRIVVFGTTGSGKTTLAQRLALRTGLPYAEQDAWNNLADWQYASAEQFVAALDDFSSQESWIMDGNQLHGINLGWQRADTLIWLDYPAPLVFWRLLTRTVRRGVTREVLWNGNREYLPERLFSPRGIVACFFRTHWRHRRDTPRRIASQPHLTVLKFNRPRDVEAWFQDLPS